MQRQTKVLRLVAVGLILCLFATPTAGVWGQEEPIVGTPTASAPTDDVGEIVEAVEVADAPGEAVSPASQAAAGPDTELLTNQVFLPVVQGGEQTGSGTESNEVAAANSSKAWTALPCANVLTSERGLWDDMPGTNAVGIVGAVPNNEAGLSWFIANQSINEGCSYISTFTGITTGSGSSSVNLLRWRVAVSDGALFYMTVYRTGPLGVCSTTTAWLTSQVNATNDDSLYRVFNLALPAGSTICAVRINLSDDPDSIGGPLNGQRISALIDYIQLRNSVNGAVFWQEQF